MFESLVLGGVITDATATPELVKEGYVFYNNDGRQIGTNPKVPTLNTLIIGNDTGDGKISANLASGVYTRTRGLSATSNNGSYIINNNYTISDYDIANSPTPSQWYTGDTGKYVLFGMCINNITLKLSSIYKLFIAGEEYKFTSSFNPVDSYYIYTGKSVGSGSIINSNNSSFDVTLYPIFKFKDTSLSSIGICIALKKSLITTEFTCRLTTYTVSSIVPMQLVYLTED